MPSLCNAQALYRDEVDKFTGAKIKESTIVNLKQGFSRKVHISARRVNDKLFLDVSRYQPTVFSISEGASLYFLFDNSKSIPIPSKSSMVARANITSGITTWSGTITYEVPKEYWSTFAEQIVTDLRFYENNGYDNFEDIKKGRAEDFKKAINLVLE